ncbi:MAG: UPF0158 family protein [Leucobacter sp.]
MDKKTGDVIPAALTDSAVVGDEAIDVDEEPDRYLWINHLSGRDAWDDMVAFVQYQREPRLIERFESTVTGTGAFQAFRDLIHATGLDEQWDAFSTDRQLGRARGRLAEEGIRAMPRIN